MYFQRTKAVTSVNSFDGFSSVVVNNTLFHIYDGRMFVTNNSTIKKKKKKIVFLMHKSRHKR